MTDLSGQKVVVIGGSAGIGLETARGARAGGAEVLITGRNAERLAKAAAEVGAESSAFDALDPPSLARFLAELEGPVDHVVVTAGAPYYAPLPEIDFDEAARTAGQHLTLPLEVARGVAGKVRPPGSLTFFGGTGARHPAAGLALATAITNARPPLIAALALEVAPVRVNLIAPGFVDTPLSASILGDDLEARREELRTHLPIGRVVGPEDVAALALHLMTNTALTGATYDIDGGQQFASFGD
jgi:NAD(P)-dependent dehydrogenase (short-subunit alcohol dehydrogenase family)